MFKWDSFSDQPYPIRDREFKKSIYKRAIFDTIKMVFTNLLLIPIILVRFIIALFQKRSINVDKFFAMGIHLGCSRELIDELGVKSVLIRVPLCDIENISEYEKFIDTLDGYDILVNILQDREHIEDHELLKRSITLIFSRLKVKEYQIGNAINRKKWAFFTMDEYLKFYRVIQDIRDKNFKDIKLIGSSVIDFEFHFTIRTLFNFYRVKYDTFSSLLYVDRRGSPLNSQAGFDLVKKIKLLYAIVSLSPKSSNKIFITETNWPILDTAPYAPTSQKECVSLDDYALFMVLYHLLTISSGMISRVYWHQLVAPGYGLVDSRQGLKKYPAFEAYKTMVRLLDGAKLIEFDFKNEIKYMKFKKNETIELFWSKNSVIKKHKKGKLISLYGEDCDSDKFVYLVS